MFLLILPAYGDGEYFYSCFIALSKNHVITVISAQHTKNIVNSELIVWIRCVKKTRTGQEGTVVFSLKLDLFFFFPFC